MTDITPLEINPFGKFPATVVKIIDQYTVVINRGSSHGIKSGDKFLIYSIDPNELLDPDTKESLGNLEIVKGDGVAVHTQEKITTIKSGRYISKGRIIRKAHGGSIGSLVAALGGQHEVIEEPGQERVPFDQLEIGDKAKPI